MNYTISKGKHRAWPFSFGLWYNKKQITKKVVFQNNCNYSIEGEDMQDTNKLFGVGYFPSHHLESARFGWVYNPDRNNIKLVAYCYINGQRIIQDLLNVPMQTEITCTLNMENNKYTFTVEFGIVHFVASVNFLHRKKWAFPLGIFFGGNKTAPQKINISMK